MTYAQLLQYCQFFKGEGTCPSQYDGKDGGKLWQAEKVVSEDLPNIVDGSNPRESLAQAVSCYVGKWSSYNLFDVMDTYFEKCLDLRSTLT